MCSPYEPGNQLKNENIVKELEIIRKNSELQSADDLTIDDLIEMGEISSSAPSYMSIGAIKEIVQMIQEIGEENGFW